MNETDRLIRLLSYETAEIKSELQKIDEELKELPYAGKSIVIKKIKGNLYYYLQWREDGKTRGKYLGPVHPGGVCEEERKIQRYRELTVRKNTNESLLVLMEKTIKKVKKEKQSEKILEDYTFEVFWDDEITARVSVKGSDVQVSRYIIHPVKQIFAADHMTRNQLNEILEMRCWDRNRADIVDILKSLGLDSYNPREIVKKTHGVSYNDYIWFRFPGEQLIGADVLVR